ncbi:hypothetical protein SDC9_146422 [bioreactor metagenome]|uniref:Uncharacterized protein n=1 Tax=bioreactor metagenome TaxID=1076179 RepID=A0A645ED00_9ZZZZ
MYRVTGSGFKLLEDLAGAQNDSARDAGQLSHMDAIRTVGTARHDVVQEDHLIVHLGNCHIVITHTWQQRAELGQLMIVGGKQGAGFEAGMVVNKFHDCPGNGKAIIGRSTAADLIQDQQ